MCRKRGSLTWPKVEGREQTHIVALDTFERYLVEEFYDDYREGLITRRVFTRRVAFIAGSMTATAAVMAAVGCAPEELPDESEPMPRPAADSQATSEARSEAPAAGSAAAPAAARQSSRSRPAGAAPTADRSALSVTEADPSVVAENIVFPAGDDQVAAYLARPAEGGSHAAILVCHENRGLVEHIRDVARRFAKAGYVALALDLLSREGGTAAFDRDAVPGALTRAGAERHVADFVAGFAYLRTLDFVDPERIGMTGYCFGGGITWRTATAIPELKAAVPFYGPAPKLNDVGNIKAAVLGVYAELDDRINAGVAALEQSLAAADVEHQLKVYPGVNHAFHNDTGPRYDQPQATQAWLDTLAWFERHL